MPAKPSLTSLQEKASAHAQKAKEMQTKIKQLENERYLAIGREVAKHQPIFCGTLFVSPDVR